MIFFESVQYGPQLSIFVVKSCAVRGISRWRCTISGQIVNARDDRQKIKADLPLRIVSNERKGP